MRQKTTTIDNISKSPYSRSEICKYLEFLGIKLDQEANKIKGEEACISAPDSKTKLYIIPTNEEIMIARDTYRLCK